MPRRCRPIPRYALKCLIAIVVLSLFLVHYNAKSGSEGGNSRSLDIIGENNGHIPRRSRATASWMFSNFYWTRPSLEDAKPRENLPECARIPPNLRGVLHPRLGMPSFGEMEHDHADLLPGGRWRPPNCRARHRVAVIVPFRDRYEHLRMFLDNIHFLLKRQQLEYGIFIVEQAMPTRFNRAMLLNIGFVEALRQADYQCVVFHDVDLLPEDDRNLYTCPARPRHMSAGVDVLGYRLPYGDIFGGVTALKKEHFLQVNGYSNIFFGWGGEDDDMSSRLRHHNLTISRYPQRVARYKMLSHKKGPENPNRFKFLVASEERFSRDGLNSLKYRLIRQELRPLYTWVYVDINQKLVMQPWENLLKIKIIAAPKTGGKSKVIRG